MRQCEIITETYRRKCYAQHSKWVKLYNNLLKTTFTLITSYSKCRLFICKPIIVPWVVTLPACDNANDASYRTLVNSQEEYAETYGGKYSCKTFS